MLIDLNGDAVSHLISENLANSPKTKSKIILFDAPAGAGKTYVLCKLAVDLANAGERILFVQPTKDLITATLKKIQEEDKYVDAFRIDETNTKHVVLSIIEYMKNADREGQILFITHASFERIAYVHRKNEWNLLIDEALQSHRSVPLKFKFTHAPLTDHLLTTPTDETWSKVEIGNQAGLSVLRDKMMEDDGLKLFEPAVSLVGSQHWNVYVHTDGYTRFVSDVASKAAPPQLFGLLKPSICEGYKSVRIAGARISESLLVKSWRLQGAQMQFEALDSLRYKAHTACERVTIYYAIKENWSKYLRNKHEQPLWKPLLRKISELADEQQFMYSANNDRVGLFMNDGKANRLPNAPHGLNDFTHFNFVAFLSARNLNPQYNSFLQTQGMTDDEIRCDLYYGNAYQAIMRGGLREPKNTEPQTIVVPDMGLALWLQSIFQGSKIEWLGFLLPEGTKKKSGRTRIYSSDAERKKAHRNKLSTRDYLQIWKDLIDKLPNHHEDDKLKCTEYCDEIDFINVSFVPRFQACIWESVEQKTNPRYVVASSHDQFIYKLREYHRRTVSSKESNRLMTLGCPAPDPISMRRAENMAFANGIMIDNDGGDLTPDEFANLFPHTAMVIYNTYSCTSLHRRWRAYIPTEYIMHPDMYKNVIEQIFIAVEKEGFNKDGTDGKRKHGFDKGKKNAANVLYLPCQAGEADASFFLEYRDSQRKPLDPTQWINFDDEPEAVQSFVRSSSTAKTRNGHSKSLQEEIDLEIERWRNGNVARNRDQSYSTLYYALKRKCVTSSLIEEIMTGEAQMCGTKRLRDARLGQLKRLIKCSNR